MITKNLIGKTTKALLNPCKLPHHKQLEPTKADLEQKFLIRVMLIRNGKPTLKEVD